MESAVPHEEGSVPAVSVEHCAQLWQLSGQDADSTSEVKRADQSKKILPEVQFSEKLFLSFFTLLF